MAPTVRPEKTNCSNSAIVSNASQALQVSDLAVASYSGSACRAYRAIISAAGDHRPIAASDFEDMECRQVEAHVVGRRHVHDSSRADVAFCPLDFVAHLGCIGALRALHGLD